MKIEATEGAAVPCCSIVRDSRTIPIEGVHALQHEDGALVHAPTSGKIADILTTLCGMRAVEEFWCFALDAKNRIQSACLVSRGILTASLVHPREVFTYLIAVQAAGFVIGHNHPSGDPEPSHQDLEVNSRLAAVGELVGIPMLDSLVVAEDGRYVSALERGLLS